MDSGQGLKSSWELDSKLETTLNTGIGGHLRMRQLMSLEFT